MAREIARGAEARNIAVHYPLLASGALAGYAVWEMGYSSSVALAVATAGNPTEAVIGRLIPIQETLLASWNLLTIPAVLAVIVGTVLLLHRQFALTGPHIPDDLDLIYHVGLLLKQLGRAEALETLLVRVSAAQPDDPRVHAALHHLR